MPATVPEVPDDRIRARQRQLAGDLRAQILAGDIGPGERIPSTAALTRRYAVNNMTVTRALAILKAEGLLTGHKGRSVVTTGRRPAEIPAAADRPPGGAPATVGEVPAPAPVAEALGLDRDEPVLRRHHVRLLDGEPAELIWSYYPLPVAYGSALTEADPLPGGAPAVLAALGHPLRRAIDRVSVRPATVTELIALRLPGDVPVLRQFRIGFTDGDRPVEVTVMIKAGQRFEIRYDLPVPPG
ncbi:GntR family transcriptional regulator [Actinoplanes sp. NPDC051851]|uniref:GntR family transcriptional regulator n=1 Tax=Actinoplanes sp. NPDC051851 TaxID=3154753 RepID=UPI00343EEC24